MTGRGAVVLVVPCYNEERRLQRAALLGLAQSAEARLLFVDDGSTDGTRGILDSLAQVAPESIEVLRLDRNLGKGEAVRRGLLRALAEGAEIVGYADADLSTPASELERLIVEIRTGSAEVVLGSRVALLGAKIRRSPLRHYLGRVFATAASLVLHLPVYDTQCGAKLFRVGPALRASVETPFDSSWAFDVELIARLLTGHAGGPGLTADDFVEIPLRQWTDVEGGTLGALAMARAAADLVRIGVSLAARRR